MDILTYAMLLKRIHAIGDGQIVAARFRINSNGLLQYYIDRTIDFTVDEDGILLYDVDIVP